MLLAFIKQTLILLLFLFLGDVQPQPLFDLNALNTGSHSSSPKTDLRQHNSPHNNLSHIPLTLQPCQYDTHLVKKTSQIWVDGAWADQKKEISFYDLEKNLLEFSIEYLGGDSWLENIKKYYIYNSKNQLMEQIEQVKNYHVIWTNDRKYLYSYDENDNLQQKIIQRWRDGEWQNYYRYSYQYDMENRLIEELEERWYNRIGYPAWNVWHKTSFIYNNDGYLIEYKKDVLSNVVWRKRERGEYIYDETGNLIEYLQYQRLSMDTLTVNFREEFIYDDHNRLSTLFHERYFYFDDRWGDASRKSYFYDDYGKLIQIVAENLTDAGWIFNNRDLYFFDDYDQNELRYYGNQADYIIITPENFKNQLAEFVDWRQGQGLNVIKVDLQQIYSEFQDTDSKVNAIRDFVSYTQKFWQKPEPRYLLLIGDTEIIPSVLITSSNAEEGKIPIDEWFTINIFENDSIPDLAIGRFPVHTSEQLQNIISKTIRFEQDYESTNNVTDFLFLNDEDQDPGTQTVFENLASSFISSIIPADFYVKRIDIRESSPYFGSSQEFLNEINNGTFNLIYYGHGTPAYWSKSRYFTKDDIDYIDQSSQPFFLSTISCSQNFDLAEEQSLVEKLLTFPGGGAVATLASSGFNSYITGDRLFREIYAYILENNDLTIGQAILEAKRTLGYPNAKPDAMLRRFTLLGDPCLRLPYSIQTRHNDENISTVKEFSLAQNYPNPFNPTTMISFNLPSDGHIVLNVFDLTGRIVKTILHGNKNSGTFSVLWDGKNEQGRPIASGIYIYQLLFKGTNGSSFVQCKKMSLVR